MIIDACSNSKVIQALVREQLELDLTTADDFPSYFMSQDPILYCSILLTLNEQF